MNYLVRFLLLAGAVCLVPIPSQAMSDSVILGCMRQGAASTLSLEGSFYQTKRIPFMDIPLLSSGKICFDISKSSSPIIFWEYTSPQRTGFSLGPNGSEMWTDEGSSNQAQDTFLKAIITEMLSWISFDQKILEKNYQISVVNEHSVCLRPRKKNPLFSEANINFTNDYSLVKSIIFIGEKGDSTSLSFTITKRNQPLSNECMR